MPAKYKVPGKPLDFSFLKLTEIAKLRKVNPRDGKRKPIPESDEEEQQTKGDAVANTAANPDELEEDKSKEQKETVIRAP